MPKVIAMNSHAQLDRINRMLGEAKVLAADDNVLVRVAGERIAVILADTLFEIDPGLPEVISLLPQLRRG